MKKAPELSNFTPSKSSWTDNKKITENERAALISNGIPIVPPSSEIKKLVSIREIFEPTHFVRFDIGDEYDDLEVIETLDPVKVAVSKSIDGYFLIDGHRRLKHAKRSGESKVKVEVVGSIVCMSQIGMARGKAMLDLRKTLNTIELSNGLMALHDQIIADFGQDSFFIHGGDRRNIKNKQSLPEYIAKWLGLRKTTVDTLLRFGHNIGPLGLEGLMMVEGYELSLRTINQINAELKGVNVGAEIEKAIKPLKKANAKKDELLLKAGRTALNHIKVQSSRIKDSSLADIDNNDDDNIDFTPSKKLPPIPNNRTNQNVTKVNRNKKNKRTVNLKDITSKIEKLRSALNNLTDLIEKVESFKEIDDQIYRIRWSQVEKAYSRLSMISSEVL